MQLREAVLMVLIKILFDGVHKLPNSELSLGQLFFVTPKNDSTYKHVYIRTVKKNYFIAF